MIKTPRDTTAATTCACDAAAACRMRRRHARPWVDIRAGGRAAARAAGLFLDNRTRLSVAMGIKATMEHLVCWSQLP